MSNITITVDIPALDRLCGWLESRERASIVQQIEDEIVAKLKAAAGDGTLAKAATEDFQEATNDPDLPWKGETAETAQEAAKTEPTKEPTKESPVTLASVQQTCARLRDAGRLAEVKALFPEFGIKKLSDLKNEEQLAAFAVRLKTLEE